MLPDVMRTIRMGALCTEGVLIGRRLMFFARRYFRTVGVPAPKLAAVLRTEYKWTESDAESDEETRRSGNCPQEDRRWDACEY